MFSNLEIQTISKQVLGLPDQLAAANEQLTNAYEAKAAQLVEDDAHRIFYDRIKANIECYFQEKEAMSGAIQTRYLDTDLDAGARQALNALHFPSSPIWVNFQPKLIPSVQGLPLSNTLNNESQHIADLIDLINFLKFGFNDGSENTTTSAPFSGSTLEVSTTMPIGDRIFVSAASGYLYATVTGILSGPTSTSLNLSIIEYAGSIPSGATVRNYFSGVSNGDRQGSGGSNAFVFSQIKSRIHNYVTAWFGRLAGQGLSLELLSVFGTEKTQQTTALASVDNSIAQIQTWRGLDEFGISGRFTDSSLAILESLASTRLTLIPSRLSEIDAALGTVTQASNGSYTGSGHFLSLFRYIDFRASKAGGSLNLYYGADLILAFAQQKINSVTAQSTELSQYMIVKKIVAEIPAGSDEIEVSDTSSLFFGDTVKVVSESDVSDAIQITQITGNTIKLSQAMSGFSVDAIPRLVKLL